MYNLPSSSSGKPHVVALDKEVGAHLGCILFSIIMIMMMVMIRRSRRMHDYSDYYGDDQEEEKEDDDGDDQEEEKEDAWGSTQSGPVQSNRDQPLSLPVF